SGRQVYPVCASLTASRKPAPAQAGHETAPELAAAIPADLGQPEIAGSLAHADSRVLGLTTSRICYLHSHRARPLFPPASRNRGASSGDGPWAERGVASRGGGS